MDVKGYSGTSGTTDDFWKGLRKNTKNGSDPAQPPRAATLIGQIDNVPAQPVELFQQRQLDVVSLVELDVLGSFLWAHLSSTAQ